MNPSPLQALAVRGPWKRLQRPETAPLAGMLSLDEREAVNARLRARDDRPSRMPVPETSGPEGGRFARPRGPGALYLGNHLDTCVAEVAYHHGLRCADSGCQPGTKAFLTQLVFRVSGDLADATAAPNASALHHPTDYGPSWVFGSSAREAEWPGVSYESVRRAGGRCLAVFLDQIVRFQKVEFGAVVLEWDGAVSRRIA